MEDHDFVNGKNIYLQKNAQIWSILINTFTNVSFKWHKFNAI